MSTSRRDLLKWFGAGTLIAPIVGAAPVARLIEVPKVELIEPKALIVKPIRLEDVESFTVTLQMKDGSSETFRQSAGYRSGVVTTKDHIDLSFCSERVLTSPVWNASTGHIEGASR